MVTYEFCIEDLARTRFAISPPWGGGGGGGRRARALSPSGEAVASLRLLLDPCRAALHLPWLSELRDGRLGDLDLRAAAAMLPAEGYIPDFLTPPPTGPLGEFEGELDTVRATSADQVRHDVEWLLEGRPPPAV